MIYGYIYCISIRKTPSDREVLNVSYCFRPMSIFLVCNKWVNMDETSEQASSQCLHQSSFKCDESMHNSGFNVNDNGNIFLNFSATTGCPNFK